MKLLKYILLFIILFILFFCTINKINADIFLNNATIIGNPANHDEVISFVLPLHKKWETENWIFGYRVWINKYQMIVLTIENGIDKNNNCKFIWTDCQSYVKDLSQQNGILNTTCNLQELSSSLYYMPEKVLNELMIYYNYLYDECY